MIRTLLAATTLTLSLGAMSAAQQTPTLDSAIEQLYASISGPVGAPRDFDTLRGLFLDGAPMTIAGPGEAGDGQVTTMQVDGYIERAGEQLVNMGFTEIETRRAVYRYGELATVLSAYEGTRADTGARIVTGINMITLARHEGNWKIAALAWRHEDEDWPVAMGFEPADE